MFFGSRYSPVCNTFKANPTGGGSRAALPASLKRRFLKHSSFAAQPLQVTSSERHCQLQTHLHARTHAHTLTHKDTHARSLAAGSQTPLPRQWGWAQSHPRCSVRRSLANSVQSVGTNGDQDILHVNAPSQSRECTTDRGVHRSSLKPLVGGFLFAGLTFSLHD